jgi:hypothetical protein
MPMNAEMLFHENTTSKQLESVSSYAPYYQVIESPSGKFYYLGYWIVTSDNQEIEFTLIRNINGELIKFHTRGDAHRFSWQHLTKFGLATLDSQMPLLLTDGLSAE